MKKEIKTGYRGYPSIRIRIAGSDAKKGVELSIELLPVRNTYGHRQKRKKRRAVTRPKANFKKFVARPVVGYMNIFGKIDLGKRMYVHMIHNTDFPDPFPPLWSLGNVTEALDDAYYEAIHGGEKEKEILGQKEKAFDVYFLELVKYVDRIAKGSADIYKSAGMEPMLVYEKPQKEKKK